MISERTCAQRCGQSVVHIVARDRAETRTICGETVDAFEGWALYGMGPLAQAHLCPTCLVSVVAQRMQAQRKGAPGQV